MQPAEAVDGGLDCGGCGFPVGGIAHVHENTVLRQSGSGFFEAGCVDIEHHDTRAFIEKPARSRQADAGRRARDDHGSVFETVRPVSFDVGTIGI